MRPKNLEKEEAIRVAALRMIAEEGLENLSMQRLAKAANVSPRTIYIKYEHKEDLLIKLFIEVVLGAYEAAVLEGFSEDMAFAEGVKKIWLNAFRYFKSNRPAFVLFRYGKSSPLLNKAYQQANITEGKFFSPIHRFLKRHVATGTIRNLPRDAQRALLFAPLIDMVQEYFDYIERPRQIITERVMAACCEAVIKGMAASNNSDIN